MALQLRASPAFAQCSTVAAHKAALLCLLSLASLRVTSVYTLSLCLSCFRQPPAFDLSTNVL
jgi:hypothetical protein